MMDGMVRMAFGFIFRLVGALRLSVVLHSMGSEGIRKAMNGSRVRFFGYLLSDRTGCAN